MTTIADRITGAFIAATGLVLYFFVIPNSVETVDSGWLLPQTMPNLLVLLLTAMGAILVVKPANHQIQPVKQFVMCGIYLGLISAGLLAMSYIGFMVIGPIIALAIMGLIGERRPFWLILGAAGIPAVIWVILVWFLERGLP
jgi:putative tricarboxylic transport membrane protein